MEGYLLQVARGEKIMSRSSESIDREIERIANEWNYGSHGEMHDKIASAMHFALRWARGRREIEPSMELRKRYGKKTDKS